MSGPEQDSPGALRHLRVVLVLKTNEGGAWVLPHVTELRRRGHHVVVLLPAGPGRLRARLDGLRVPVREVQIDFDLKPGPAVLAGLRRLRRQIRAERPDVVHYHLIASAIAARLATTGMGCTRVHMVAGPLYLDSRVIRCAERVLSRWDTHVVAGSRHTRDRYLALGVPVEKLSVTAYGVDTEHFSPATAAERAEARRRLGVGRDEFVAVMVAYVYGPKNTVHRGVGIKGHAVLVEAWRRLQAAEPGGRLVLVGGGFDPTGRRHREELMASMGPERSTVTWLDSVDDVRTTYAAADVSVSPSLSENHGAALEAGACGVPSIVSDAGGLPETVDGHSGWVLPRGDVDALVSALSSARATDRVLLARRGAAARRRVVAEFDSRRGAQRLVDTIEGVHGGGDPRIAIVTEARFVGNGSAGWRSADGVNGDAQWSRYRSSGALLSVVGRADDRPVPEGPAMTTRLCGLPWYDGLLGFVVALPRLVVALTQVARQNDVLVLRLPGPLGLIAWAVAELVGTPTAVELVGDPHQAAVAAGLPHPAAALLARATRVAVGRSRAVRYVTRTVLQEGYPPRPQAEVLAISNVRLPPGAFVGRPRSVVAPPAGGRLLAIGSQQNAHKGHDVLIRAVAGLHEQGRPVELVLVGDGGQRSSLELLAQRLALTGSIRFEPGLMSPPELRALMSASDVLVHPSRTEGLPRVVIEAMAQAVPVVASDVGGLPELLDDAVLVPPGDPVRLTGALEDLLSDARALSGQSVRNLETARAYTEAELDARFRVWSAVLRSLAGGKRG